MKKILIAIAILFYALPATSQTALPPKTELYDLINKLITDSTGYENIGDWAVGQPKKYPVVWKADKIEMSNDTSINFFRLGAANIMIKGKTFMTGAEPVRWNIMLKGPRMGYGSFAIISTTSTGLNPRMNIDSIFGSKPFKAKLLKTCDAKDLAGYYYYELKLPKKDLAFLKISWISNNGNTAMRIDCYDNYSKYAVKLDCPK